MVDCMVTTLGSNDVNGIGGFACIERRPIGTFQTIAKLCSVGRWTD